MVIKIEQFDSHEQEKRLEEWSKTQQKENIINIQYLNDNHTIRVFYWSED